LEADLVRGLMGCFGEGICGADLVRLICGADLVRLI